MEVDGRWFFSMFFPFPIEAFSGSMLSMLFVFGFMYGVFRPEKGGLSLSSPGNSYGDLIRPSLAGPVIRCWISPLTPNLGICWVNESPLWCRTWLKNFYRKKLLAVTMFQLLISVQSFQIPGYIFLVRLDKRYPSLSTTGSGSLPYPAFLESFDNKMSHSCQELMVMEPFFL